MPNDIVDPGSELDAISPPDLSPAVPTPVQRAFPPAAPALPPGAGFTYSSQGPADWSQTRTFTAPGGLEIPIPRNAVNPTFVQGPPPEDPKTVLVRKALNSVPVDHVWQAIEAAGNFLAGQAFNREYKKQMEAHGDPIKAGQAAMAASASYYTNPEMRRKAMETAGKMGADVSPTWMPADPTTGRPGAFIGPRRVEIPRPPTPVRPPDSVRLIDEALKANQEATAAEQAGNTELAKSLRERANLLMEQTKKPQMQLQFDDQGRLMQASMGTAPAPTVATASRAQQKLQKYENATEIINRLQRDLEAGHVGIAGLAGEYLWDRGMVQALNLLGDQSAQADPGRVNSRAGIIMARESLMREISDDPRFSNVDREEIAKALPSSGAFESLSDAKTKLATVREIISQRSKVYANSIGKKPPLFSMSKDEIKKAYESGQITRDEAKEALRRFHF